MTEHTEHVNTSELESMVHALTEQGTRSHVHFTQAESRELYLSCVQGICDTVHAMNELYISESDASEIISELQNTLYLIRKQGTLDI